MFRKLTLSIAAGMMMTIGAHAQQTYFNTSFDEGMPESFQLWDIDGLTPDPTMAALGFNDENPWVVITEERTGNQVAASTSWYKPAGQSNDWMVLPALEIKDAEAKLQWRSRAYDKDLSDGLKVYIGQWTDVTTEREYLCDEDFDLQNPLYSSKKEKIDWTFHEVSLADYVGQTVYIAFVNDSKDKHMLFVDDIFVGIPSAVNLVLDFGRCYDGYGDLTISGKALCQGTQAVEGFTVGFEMNGQTIEQTFDDVLEPGAQMAFTLDEKPYLERNATADYRAWIASGDDRVEISGKVSAFLWKVVAEEITGTWCQYCVRGLGAMNYMRDNDPDGFIGIGIHNNNTHANVPDSMAIPGEEYLEWIMSSYSMSGFPHCVLNRNAQYSTDPGNIPTYTQKIKQTTKNYYGLTLDAEYDPATNLIQAHTEVFFANDFTNANFKLAYIVIENDVHRTHEETGILHDYCGYDQVNGYAGSTTPCYGYEALPGIINADDMWYHDVARGYKGADGYKGEGDLFPKTIAEGDHFTHEYELEMPETVLKKENTELVVLLMNKAGAIVNAEKCAIPTAETDPTGIVVYDAAQSRRTESKVYDLQGRRLAETSKSGLYIVNGKKVMVK